MFVSSARRSRPSLAQPLSASAATIQFTSETTVPGVYTGYSWKNLSFLLWFGPATMESLAIFEQGCKSRCEKHPEGVSSIHIMVPGGSSLPSAQVRDELARIIRAYAHHSAATAVVLRGQGFWASALSGMVTALSMLGPRGFKLRIFNSAVAAASWLPALHAQRTGVQIDPEELLHVLNVAEAAGLAGASRARSA